MTDRAGRALAPGSAVVLRGGEHAGGIAEVVGWGGRRGVEVVVHGAPPAFLAVPPALVELVDVALLDPIVPRRPHRASATAGGARQATNHAVGEPEPHGAVASGAGGGPAPRWDQQDPHVRPLARAEAGRQPGPPQPAEVAPQALRRGGP